MEMPSVKTQGTNVFFVDTLTSSEAIVRKMVCPTAVTGLGGAADQIDDTCLEETTDRTFFPGLGNPGQVTIPFVFKPSEMSHQLLFDLDEAKILVDWMVALSDGVGVPALDSDLELQDPGDRTAVRFQGYIADVNIDIATNEVVRGTLIVQRSGARQWFWKAAA